VPFDSRFHLIASLHIRVVVTIQLRIVHIRILILRA
jgi:hypothetical protein